MPSFGQCSRAQDRCAPRNPLCSSAPRYSILVPGSGATGTPPEPLAVVLPEIALLGLTGPVPRSAGCAIDDPLIAVSLAIGALFTLLLPASMDAVLAGMVAAGTEDAAFGLAGAAVALAGTVSVGPLK